MSNLEHHSDSAKEVLKIAEHELETLLMQRIAINQRVKATKRTIEGLRAMFGEKAILYIPVQCIELVHPAETILAAAVPGEREGHSRVDVNTDKPKLERACRIALLESEEPASAAQVYDRIMRRRSYHLSRYKHPLMHVIATLDLLANDGLAEVILQDDFRCWRWKPCSENTIEYTFPSTAISAVPQR